MEEQSETMKAIRELTLKVNNVEGMGTRTDALTSIVMKKKNNMFPEEEEGSDEKKVRGVAIAGVMMRIGN